MNIKERQEEIIQDFELFDDWMAKYEYIIDLGKELVLIDEQFKTDENKIKGCQSQVWLHAEMKGENLVFTADSDAIITKGLIALMIHVLSKAKPEDIAKADLFFIDKIGLTEHLSPTRSNGLLSMVKQMKLYGLALSA
ncbi:MAG: SufE family protein [Bacteroidota bacterium]